MKEHVDLSLSNGRHVLGLASIFHLLVLGIDVAEEDCDDNGAARRNGCPHAIVGGGVEDLVERVVGEVLELGIGLAATFSCRRTVLSVVLRRNLELPLEYADELELEANHLGVPIDGYPS